MKVMYLLLKVVDMSSMQTCPGWMEDTVMWWQVDHAFVENYGAPLVIGISKDDKITSH